MKPAARSLFVARSAFARLKIAAVIFAALGPWIAPQHARAEKTSLLPREVFFGNPEKASPRISPDGKQLAYLAPSQQSVLNVWVRTLGKSDDRMVTHDEKRGIRTYFWAHDGKHLLYQQDVNGDENFHLFEVDPATKETRDLTPHEGVRATNVEMDRKHPNEILVGLNLRDKKVFDMHRVDLTTGEDRLDTQNPGDVLGWGTDPDFVIRAAIAQNPQDGSRVLRIRDRADAPWRDLITWSAEENGGFIDFTADGKAAYVESSIGSDVTRLVKVDVASGKELETLASDPRCDLEDVLVDDSRHVPQAAAFDYLRVTWKVLDPAIQADFTRLAKVKDGDFGIVSRDDADQTWIVQFDQDNAPPSFYTYDRKTKKAVFLFTVRPSLEKARLSKCKSLTIEARDGVKLPSYLTLPTAAPQKNLPLVLYVHGGPWARDSWGYNPVPQWLANRGYAVLQVNFRSSTGFGKKFLHLGDKQWGQTMQDDLTDAVKWAVAQGIADPKRVAIMGGSYGGYATLAGLAFTPDVYACGVDIVGPSNLRTLLASIPPYWGPMRTMFDIRMGEVEKDTLFNAKISPLYHVDQMRAPLLIGQGLHDPRVNVHESDQIAAALRAKNLPVEYIVYSDEGHGFARPENRLDFYGRAEVFLAKHVGGEAEPWAEVKGASAEVR